MVRSLKNLTFLSFVFIFNLAAPILYGAPSVESTAKAVVAAKSEQTKANPSAKAGDDHTLTLKIMVVNPSQKHEQVFPLKAYLPEELKQENVLNQDGLDVSYDAEKRSYFVEGDLKLAPGQSTVKTIVVEDIWYIQNEKLDTLSSEANDLFKKLSGTKHAEQGRLLLNNIEVMLMQISERQNDKNLSPQEHISAYRENKRKVYDIEMDLMSMRRFINVAVGDGGFGASGSSGNFSMPGFSDKMKKMLEASQSGVVPSAVLWRVIFSILVFLGLVSFVFLHIWQRQMKLMSHHRELMSGGSENEIKVDSDFKITDFMRDPNEDPIEDQSAEASEEELPAEPDSEEKNKSQSSSGESAA